MVATSTAVPQADAEGIPSGARPHLSEDLILDAAMRIADARGLDALTMRTLGAELGVDPTAAYRYFRTKDALVMAVIDRYAERLRAAWEPTGHWREDLRTLASQVRAGMVAQPAMAQAFLSTPTKTRNGNVLTETGLSMLEQAGLSGRELIATYQMFENFILGSAMLDGTFYPQHWTVRFERYRQLESGRAHAFVADEHDVAAISDAAFAAGLNALMDHVERLVAS